MTVGEMYVPDDNAYVYYNCYDSSNVYYYSGGHKATLGDRIDPAYSFRIGVDFDMGEMRIGLSYVINRIKLKTKTNIYENKTTLKFNQIAFGISF